MNTIQEQWISFEALVVPNNAPAIQRQEMRRAFYAGAQAMMKIQWAIGDAGVAILEGCRDEINRFVLKIKNGEA